MSVEEIGFCASSILIIKVPIVINIAKAVDMAKDRYTMVLFIFRPKSMASSFPQSVFPMTDNRTTNETVLIPPPVEAGEAPINIKTMVINFVILYCLFKSKEKSPAVLDEAE